MSRILFIWPNKDQFGFKPISLSLLSAILKKNGHETALFDTTFFDFGFKDNSEVRAKLKIFKPVDTSSHDLSKKKVDLKKEVFDKLNDFKPEIVAFSVLSDEVFAAFEIAGYVKQWNENTIVIWGNKAPTMNPEKVLENPCVDFACIGEGVLFLPEFVGCIENGNDPRTLNNIAYKSPEGEIVKNPISPYYQDLDSLPYFDWSIYDSRQFLKPYDGKLYRGADHMICWGCPNICSYCINDSYRKLYGKNSGNFMRKYSIPRIIQELEYLVNKYNIEFFKFHDEDFCFKPISYFRDLSREYAAKINVPFTIMANAKNITPEKVKLLKDMNCVSVTMGIETGNEYLRKNILNRNETKDEIIRAFHLFNDAGIRTSAFNMLAIPFETRDTIMETIDLNQKANVNYPNAGFFFPLDGTQLKKIAIENGFFEKDSDIVFKNDFPSLKFKDIESEELVKLRERFVLYIKLPSEFQKYIKRSEVDDDIGQKLTKELYEIYEECVFKSENAKFAEDKRHVCFERLENILKEKVL